MSTATDKIASWDEEWQAAEQRLPPQDGIAVEAQDTESPEWDVCVDALLRTWRSASSLDIAEDHPNRRAVEAALAWVAFLRRRFPMHPPTCVIPEPTGGVIVERRDRLSGGHDWMCELTFYNDGRAEKTDFLDGRVVRIDVISERPFDQSD